MKISPARQAAFEILLRIENENSYSSILLSVFEEKLSVKDSALCHEITLGVLRNRILIDRWIGCLTSKKLDKVDSEVLTALRIGVYQIYMLDKIPHYSAINESVNLVKAAKKRSAGGFVNAILRRAQKGKPELIFRDEIEKISVETSTPRWLTERWVAQFGFEETRKIAEANSTPPPTYVRLTKRFHQSVDEAKAAILEVLAEISVPQDYIQLPDDCYLVRKGNEKLRQFATAGLVYFQDSASIMVADLAPGNGRENILDLCASPGSKTSRIAAGQQTGRFVVSGDLYESRTALLKDNLERQLIIDPVIVQYDAEKSLPFPNEAFDTVLVDSPCSGTGTIRRNPEIKYFLNEQDIHSLSRKQLNILKNASKVIKPGGRLIYSTCSLESDEDENVVSEFLASDVRFRPAKIPINERFLTQRGYARTFPHRDNTDGFFVAVMGREA
ncbi:MAG: 16S rRNA (cytosine(967)-C(5))-methyltransferase RsmB [Pyrinomonadaceae bacterium]